MDTLVSDRESLRLGARDVALLCLLLSVIVGSSWALTSAPEQGVVILALVAPLGVLLLLGNRLQIIPLSPTWIVTSLVCLSGVVGVLAVSHLNGQRGGSIRLDLSPEETISTGQLFVLATWALLGGVTLVTALRGSHPQGGRKVTIEAPRVSVGFALLASSSLLIVALLQLQGSLFFREEYLPFPAGSVWFALVQQLSIAAVLLLGLACRRASTWEKAYALVLLFGFLTVFFSLGTRRFAVAPAVFALGLFIGGSKRGKSMLLLIAGVGVSLLFLPIPLFVRGLNSHGLLPYLAAMRGFSLQAINWTNTANNLLIAFPLTGHVAALPGIPFKNLWIELNPLPGGRAGWYEIAPSMRLNIYTPFNSIGELANYGHLVLVAVCFAVGAFLAWLDLVIGRFFAAGRQLVALAILGLSVLFALEFLQYNLRASVRLLYYSLILALGAELFARLGLNKRVKSIAPSRGVVNEWQPSLRR